MSELRSRIIRLAHANPELRPHLIPLVAAIPAWEREEMRREDERDEFRSRVRPSPSMKPKVMAILRQIENAIEKQGEKASSRFDGGPTEDGPSPYGSVYTRAYSNEIEEALESLGYKDQRPGFKTSYEQVDFVGPLGKVTVLPPERNGETTILVMGLK